MEIISWIALVLLLLMILGLGILSLAKGGQNLISQAPAPLNQLNFGHFIGLAILTALIVLIMLAIQISEKLTWLCQLTLR